MTELEKVKKGMECCTNDVDDPYTCQECPYLGHKPTRDGCIQPMLIDALALLKEQEKEIKALRKLLDWAVECDFGLDNLGDWWTERFAEEIKEMGYTESLIHLAKRYIDVFEGGEDDG